MNIALTITPAGPGEWAVALDLALQHLPAEDRSRRRDNALAMLNSGEISAESILLARQGERLAGALVAVPLKGASCLFWPPQVASGVDGVLVADLLVRHGIDKLRLAGSKIAHVVLPAADLPLAASLLRGGFAHVTRLQFLRHSGQPALQEKPSLPGLAVESYQPSNRQLFHEALERTYVGTLDIPELNGRRSIDEIIAGHQSQGKFRPELWSLAVRDGQPVAVVMLADSTDGHGWEMAYLGVVPQARRHGIGRFLAERALNQAFQAGATQLMVAVDARNRPAQQLYEKMGFVPADEREVLLFFFADLADSPSAASRKLHQTTS